MTIRVGRDAAVTQRLTCDWAHNNKFKYEDGKAAFQKWAEWEKANPDKLKAKAPDKK